MTEIQRGSMMNVLSYRQAQAVIGNGWTVDAVAHIFSYLKEVKNG